MPPWPARRAHERVRIPAQPRRAPGRRMGTLAARAAPLGHRPWRLEVAGAHRRVGFLRHHDPPVFRPGQAPGGGGPDAAPGRRGVVPTGVVGGTLAGHVEDPFGVGQPVQGGVADLVFVGRGGHLGQQGLVGHPPGDRDPALLAQGLVHGQVAQHGLVRHALDGRRAHLSVLAGQEHLFQRRVVRRALDLFQAGLLQLVLADPHGLVAARQVGVLGGNAGQGLGLVDVAHGVAVDQALGPLDHIARQQVLVLDGLDGVKAAGEGPHAAHEHGEQGRFGGHVGTVLSGGLGQAGVGQHPVDLRRVRHALQGPDQGLARHHPLGQQEVGQGGVSGEGGQVQGRRRRGRRFPG